MLRQRWSITLFTPLLLVACGDDDAADDPTTDTVAAVDSSSDVLFADTATGPDGDTSSPPADTSTADTSVADTSTAVDSASPPVDTAASTDTAVATCQVGDTACDGFLRMRCNDPARGMEVAELCALGCEKVGGTATCAATCSPGADIGCVTGTARRCSPSGSAALVLSCLSGCDGAACAPLGAAEHEVFAADVSGVRVAGVGGAADGHLAFAWQASGSAGTEAVKVLVTDADGNALSSPVTLPGSEGLLVAQLQVRAAPDGAFAVMALVGAGGGATLWRVTRSDVGVPSAPGAALATGVDLTFPSLVAWEGAVSLYHLADAAEAGRSVVSRRDFPASGGASSDHEVDPTALNRNDIIAVRVAAGEAHVYSTVTGQLRVTSSLFGVAAGATATFDAGDLLFAGAAGLGGASLPLAFDFAQDPERAVFAKFDGATLGTFRDLGPGTWSQAVLTTSGVAVALLAADGTLAYGAAMGDGPVTPATVWDPMGGGGARSDFWLVHDAIHNRVRLVTLGTNGAAEPPRVRISAP